jgi:hypothetical protein
MMSGSVFTTVVISLVLGSCLLMVVLLAALAVTWTWRHLRLMLLDITSAEIQVGRERLSADLVHPTLEGLLPIPRDAIHANDVLALLEHHLVNRHAPVVPHTITYSPHLRYAPTSPAINAPPPPLPPPSIPSFAQLLHQGELGNGRFLLGYDLESGEVLHGTWRDLYSCAIGGQPGSGKSTAIRSLLAQSALSGGRFVVIDPHAGAGEESLGHTLGALRSCMLCEVASSDAHILEAVRYVDSIGRKRIQGGHERWPLVIAVDEATALFSRSTVGEALASLIESIAQEYRKVSVFALIMGQIWTANRTGGDSGLRDSFASALVLKMKRQQARLLLPTDMAKEAETLSVGQAILWRTNGEHCKIMIPNCTMADVEQVARSLTTGAERTGHKPLPTLEVAPSPAPSHLRSQARIHRGDEVGFEVGAEVVLDARAQRVLALFLAGQTQTEILREVWQVSGGEKYKQAAAEFQQILRTALTGHAHGSVTTVSKG